MQIIKKLFLTIEEIPNILETVLKNIENKQITYSEDIDKMNINFRNLYNFLEIKNPNKDAQLVAESIATAIEKRVAYKRRNIYNGNVCCTLGIW